MPFLMRYPKEIPAGTVVDAMVSNIDFAPTFLDYAGSTSPASCRASATGGDGGRDAEGWQLSITTATGCTRRPRVAAHYGIARPVTSSFTTTAARSARRDRSTATPSPTGSCSISTRTRTSPQHLQLGEAAHCQGHSTPSSTVLERYGDTPAS